MKNCQRRRDCVFTNIQIHSQIYSQTLTHSFICNWSYGCRRGDGRGCAMQCITPKFTFIHTQSHTHSHTHSVCMCPIWYPLKRFSLPLPALHPRNMQSACKMHWLSVWVSVCASEWVCECIVNRSVYRCAFDLQFVSLASFLASTRPTISMSVLATVAIFICLPVGGTHIHKSLFCCTHSMGIRIFVHVG